MMTIVSARQPCWNDVEHTSLNLLVTFEETSDSLGEIPFTASPKDPEPHGRELFERAVALEYGEIAEPDEETLKDAVRMKTSGLSALASSMIAKLQSDLSTLQDSVALDMATDEEITQLPMTQAQLDLWRKYRVLLSRIESQPAFPRAIDWPTQPE
ncbi:tail fiber assembly protein [Pseudomonas moraviensis]|uniref:tail fiber assembly protein n=1 Tax=Pseudomonas moraviensis TaxID=321662 RepID=UPI0022C5AD96|nr:tail fiber assembly protein [Pseudomonas moraviensis]GLH37536.1 tail fiber assembly protein [Pseudomonas moraviensis]